MSHMLARLRNVKLETVKDILMRDATEHSREGLFLDHIWQNADDAEEVLFLFHTTKDLNDVKQYIEKVHTETQSQNPEANLPVMTYLIEG